MQDRLYHSELLLRDQSYKLAIPIKIPINIVFVFYRIISIDLTAGLCYCTQEVAVVNLIWVAMDGDNYPLTDSS